MAAAVKIATDAWKNVTWMGKFTLHWHGHECVHLFYFLNRSQYSTWNLMHAPNWTELKMDMVDFAGQNANENSFILFLFCFGVCVPSRRVRKNNIKCLTDHLSVQRNKLLAAHKIPSTSKLMRTPNTAREHSMMCHSSIVCCQCIRIVRHWQIQWCIFHLVESLFASWLFHYIHILISKLN